MLIVSKLRSSISLKLNEEQVLIEHKSASRASRPWSKPKSAFFLSIFYMHEDMDENSYYQLMVLEKLRKSNENWK